MGTLDEPHQHPVQSRNRRPRPPTLRHLQAHGRRGPLPPSGTIGRYGTIVVPLAELDLDAEAIVYARSFWDEEETCSYSIGCPDYFHRPALVFAIEGARLACGAVDDDTRVVAARLLRMAADELDPATEAKRPTLLARRSDDGRTLLVEEIR